MAEIEKETVGSKNFVPQFPVSFESRDTFGVRMKDLFSVLCPSYARQQINLPLFWSGIVCIRY